MDTKVSAVGRRGFLQLGALAGAGAVWPQTVGSSASTQRDPDRAPGDFNEATIAQLQAAMASGKVSAVELTRFYLRRIDAIDEQGPRLNSVIEVNPDALAIAAAADADRRRGRVKGPLHGIPVLLKDNIDTGDRMQTTAGSFALAGAPAVRDSTVAAKLRAAGAVLLGKAALSEWANFRSTHSSSGWSGRGGQCNNPYALDRNPCGSSSGSGAAVSANLCAVALATETDGSIVCPAHANGIVGIKPTLGITSRAGVVPISHTQDTIGPHARTVADAAAVLTAIASRSADGRDPATGGVPLGWTGRARPPLPVDYSAFVMSNGLAGARLGVTRQGIDDVSTFTAAAFDAALEAMRSAGATLVDLDGAGFVFPSGDGELLVLLFDFVGDLRAYFATRVGVPMAQRSLAEAIAFNRANASVEMPFFGQEIFELAAALEPGADAPQPIFGGLTYNQALEIDRLAGVNGIDAALATFHVDAIVTPTGTPAWPTDLISGDRFEFGTSSLAAIVGYPIVTVPMGQIFGVPVGVSFIGTAFSEPGLIKVASGFEHALPARIEPQFSATLPRDHVSGIPLNPHVRPSRTPHVGHHGISGWHMHSL
jgi:amidase